MASLQNEQFHDFLLESDMQKFYHKSCTYIRFQFCLSGLNFARRYNFEPKLSFSVYQPGPSRDKIETIPDIYLELAAFRKREI